MVNLMSFWYGAVLYKVTETVRAKILGVPLNLHGYLTRPIKSRLTIHSQHRGPFCTLSQNLP
jgi:hypothetical protein